MPFTLTEAYKNIVKSGTAEIDWLVQLFYDDAGANDFIGLSGADRTVDGIFYRGIVREGGFGNVSEQLDLVKSKAKVSDISIKCQNNYPSSDDGLFSQEIWGTRKYFNRNVKIYSWVAGIDSLSDLPLIFEGRLNGAPYDLNTITLQIQHRIPYDKITIPNVKTDDGKMFFPVVRGTWAELLGDVDFPFVSESRCYPAPIAERTNKNFVSLLEGVDQGQQPSSNLYYYESALNSYVPINHPGDADAAIGQDSFVYKGGFAVSCSLDLARKMQFRIESGSIGKVPVVGGGFDNPEYAVDGRSTTDASMDANLNIDSGFTILNAKSVKYNWPIVDHYYTAVCSSIANTSMHGVTNDSVDSADINLRIGIFDLTVATLLDSLSLGATEDTTKDLSDYERDVRLGYAGEAPENLRLAVNMSLTSDGGAASVFFDATVEDFTVMIATQISGSDSVAEIAAGVGKLYTAKAGPKSTYPDSGFLATIESWKIPKDLVYVYTGFSPAQNEDFYINGIPYTQPGDIDGSKILTNYRAWRLRFWQLEPRSLSDILKQMSFEGAMTWIYNENTTRSTFVTPTYSETSTAGPSAAETKVNHLNINKDDFNKFEIKHTPFKDVVTEHIFRFDKMAATGEYRQKYTITNSARSDWSLDAKENIKEINLDYLYRPGDVIELAAYYDNISGDVKILVEMELIGIKAHQVQIGDTATFDNSNMPYPPFGQTWTNKVFMCIKSRLTPTNNKVIFREVGVIT